MGWSRFLLLLGVGLCGADRLTGADEAAAVTDEKILKAVNVDTTDQALLNYLRSRTLTEVDQEKVKTLIRQLGDDSFQIREKASAGLLALGPAVEPMLRKAT